MRNRIPFTREGYVKIQKEYEALIEQRNDAVRELSEARDMGDRSENAAYKVARWKLSSIDRRLRHLRNLLKYGVAIEQSNNGTINIGNTIVISTGNDTFEYTLVGAYESDVLQGKISIYSPVGKALKGKKAGDTIIVQTPAGPINYHIEEIRII